MYKAKMIPPSMTAIKGDDAHVIKVDRKLARGVHGEIEKKFDVKSFLGEDGIEIDRWTAPLHIRNGYRIYRGGNDLENRPVWIVELGKWDMKKLVGAGEQEIFLRYIMQAIRRAVKSIGENDTSDHPVRGAMAIVDMQGLKMNQLLSIPTVSFMIQLARTFRDHLDYLHVGFIVNTHTVATMALHLVQPIMGKVFDRVHIFDHNKEKWMTHILLHVHPSQIPPQYGGTADHFMPVMGIQ